MSYWKKKIHWLWFKSTRITCLRLWIEEGLHFIPYYVGNLFAEYDSISSWLSCGINGNSLNWKIVAGFENLALSLLRFISCSNNCTLLMHLLHFPNLAWVYICNCFFLGQWATHPCEFYYFAGHWIFPSYRHKELAFIDVKKGMSTSYS